MTPESAMEEARSGELRRIYLLVGEELALASRVLNAIRAAVRQSGVPGLNDDLWSASEVGVNDVIDTAKTSPMMATERFIGVRELERWDKNARPGAQSSKKKRAGSSPFESLLAYAKDPSPSTVLVLWGGKMDGRRKLFTTAKKEGWLVPCERLKQAALSRWATTFAAERGKQLGPGLADVLAEMCGPELGSLQDAVERLCVYAGSAAQIQESDVTECITRVRPGTVWQLTDAVTRGQLGKALASLGEVFDPRDRGLPLVGLLASQTRKSLKYVAAREAGSTPGEACKAAGIPPFKEREMEAQRRRLSQRTLSKWLEILASADLDLKGASKRPPRATLEGSVIALCEAGARTGSRPTGRN